MKALVLWSRVVLALVFAQPAAPRFNTDWGVVLPPGFMGDTIRWCSRASPSMSGYWAPDLDTIRSLEPVLGAALQRALEQQMKEASTRPAVDEYYRQYIGIGAGGRRAVYINGFHKRHLELAAKARPELAPSWRTRAVNVCDGGIWYFGAEYDPANRKLGTIEFNGRGTPADVREIAAGY